MLKCLKPRERSQVCHALAILQVEVLKSSEVSEWLEVRHALANG